MIHPKSLKLQTVLPLLYLVAVYVFLPTGMAVGLIPFAYRFYLLGFVFGLILIYTYIRCYTWTELGFAPHRTVQSVVAHILLSAGFVVCAIAASVIFRLTVYIPDWSWFYVFYILFSAPAQTFLYRSILFAEMKRAMINRPQVQIVLATSLFAFLHIIYHDITTLFLTGLVGFAWSWMYAVYQDFWGIALSHAVVGAITIVLGIV